MANRNRYLRGFPPDRQRIKKLYTDQVGNSRDIDGKLWIAVVIPAVSDLICVMTPYAVQVRHCISLYSQIIALFAPIFHRFIQQPVDNNSGIHPSCDLRRSSAQPGYAHSHKRKLLPCSSRRSVAYVAKRVSPLAERLLLLHEMAQFAALPVSACRAGCAHAPPQRAGAAGTGGVQFALCRDRRPPLSRGFCRRKGTGECEACAGGGLRRRPQCAAKGQLLDELPEFGSKKLETLRQPLEDRLVTISRASGTLTFPASFMLTK